MDVRFDTTAQRRRGSLFPDAFPPLPLAGEGWGEGKLGSRSQELPSSAFGTFSRKREKEKRSSGEGGRVPWQR